jgi:hypothetical protein
MLPGCTLVAFICLILIEAFPIKTSDNPDGRPASCGTQDTARNLSYVFINEGDVYTNTDGSLYSYVTVINTQTQTARLGPLQCYIVLHDA